MFPSHVMGTFGTNRIYTVGRVVKVKDLMRFERFAPREFDSLRISNAKFISCNKPNGPSFHLISPSPTPQEIVRESVFVGECFMVYD